MNINTANLSQHENHCYSLVLFVLSFGCSHQWSTVATPEIRTQFGTGFTPDPLLMQPSYFIQALDRNGNLGLLQEPTIEPPMT